MSVSRGGKEKLSKGTYSKVKYTVVLEPELVRAFKAYCKRQARTQSYYITRALEQLLGKRKVIKRRGSDGKKGLGSVGGSGSV